MCGLALLAATIPARAAELPPPAAVKPDFTRDIKPILLHTCANCHAGDKRKGGLSINTRADLLRGGESGPAVTLNRSDKSLLIEAVAGVREDLVMPAKGARLSAKQVGLLRAWIDQGLPWEEGFSFGGRVRKTDLSPRRPVVPDAPAGASLPNPIDRFLAPYFKANGVDASRVVDDRTFIRRAYLDLLGLLPPPDAVAGFVSDTSADKRQKLIAALLADDKAYAEHWLTFWNDLLRNDYRGTGYIDGGRQQISDWLYRSLAENKPYDRFVRELITAAPGAEGFVKGIVWRGTVNASQVPPMQAARNVSQVFMGINLKCASCHDSFINDWKLDEAYGLAAVFTDAPLEIHRCNEPTGQMAKPAFLYEQFGGVDAALPRGKRLEQLAASITSPKNGRLARTMVNRLWALFIGRGLIEPIDDMDADPWHNDLLDWLASDLAEHGYDLRHTMRRILTSRAYQLPGVGFDEASLKSSDYVFRGPFVRRMAAEQLVDAVSTLTGGWHNKPDFKPPVVAPAATDAAGTDAAGTDAAGTGDKRDADVRIDANWIWSHANAARADNGGRIFIRKVIQLPAAPAQADAVVTADNEFALHVNGKRIAASENWAEPKRIDLRPHLTKGTNVIGIEAINYPDPVTKKGLQFSGANPGGAILFARVRGQGAGDVWDFGTDASWVWSTTAAKGWDAAGFRATGWKHVSQVAAVDAGPWNIGDKFVAAFGQPREADGSPGVRAALVTADPLMRALDRPNREQVVTSRPTLATTLQALELTNGQTLADQLTKGAQYWLSKHDETRSLVHNIYEQAFGRAPTAGEAQTAAALVGSPPMREGVEDLLWVIVMLPEFQLIH